MSSGASLKEGMRQADQLADIIETIGLRKIICVEQDGQLIDFTDPVWKQRLTLEIPIQYRAFKLNNQDDDAIVVKDAILFALKNKYLNDAIRLYTLNYHLFKKEFSDLAGTLSGELLKNYTGYFRLVGKMGGTEIQWALATSAGIVTPISSQPTHVGELNDSLEELEARPENSLDALMKRIVAPMTELINLVGKNRVRDYYFSAPGFFAADGRLAADQTNVANMKQGFYFDQEIPRYLKEASGIAINGMTVHDGTGHAFGDKSIYGPFSIEDTIYGFWVGTGIAARVSTAGLNAFTGGEEFNELHNELPHSTLWQEDQKRFVVLGNETRGYRPTAAQKQERLSLEERASGKALSQALIEEYNRLIQTPSDAQYDQALDVQQMLNDMGKKSLDLEAVRALARKRPALMTRVYQERAFELGLGIGSLLHYLVNYKWQDGAQFNLADIKIPVGGVIAQLNSLGLFDKVREGIVDQLVHVGVSADEAELVAANIGMSPIDDDMRELLGGLADKSFG